MGALQRSVTVERVTAMQHPAVAGVDCDASVTSGVAGQRDEHDAGSYFVELLRRCESSPGFSFWAVFDDAQLGCPLLVAISNLLLTGGRGECRERFRSGDVDLRMRKIRYAADMVRVEVRDHNVADVLTAEAELVDLVRRRFGGHQHGSGDEPDRPHSSRRIGAVVQAETGIDEDQPVVCLDEQHVTDTRGSAGNVHVPQLRW